jgi:hypothetical protein
MNGVSGNIHSLLREYQVDANKQAAALSGSEKGIDLRVPRPVPMRRQRCRDQDELFAPERATRLGLCS